MCGIIGYIGNKPAQPILLKGLKRMEYRGYDSAGIVTLRGKSFDLTRTVGKVSALRQSVGVSKTQSKIGMGHNRWATHGEPSSRNAHPHVGGRIVIVHNGIVENFEQLKVELISLGASFSSDTDSEVLAWLIDHYYKSNSLKSAVQKALARVEGAYGLIVMAQNEPKELVVARRSSPIVIGRGKGGMYIASDAAALAGYADEVVHLEDDELAVCQGNSYEIYSLEGRPHKRDMEAQRMVASMIRKNGYDHFLIKEIMEQPDAVRSVLSGRLDYEHGTSHLGGLNLSLQQITSMEHIFITGCGTAYYSGLFAKYYLEKITGLPVSVEPASEFRYREAVVPKNSVGLLVSQSGETADTRAALQEFKRRGVPTIGMVNVVASTIAREVDGGIYLHAGPEISVASTKAFTNQVLAIMLFGLHIACSRGLSVTKGREIVQALRQLPTEIEEILKLHPSVKQIGRSVAHFDHAFYLGRDAFYPIAMEGSHKLKEISYVHAEAYASGEMKHGANALIDESLLVVYLLANGPLFEKSLSNLAEVQARRGQVLVVTDNKDYGETHPATIYTPTSSVWTAPLLFNVVLQLLAYEIAVAKGREVDQPRNLAKSVTVE